MGVYPIGQTQAIDFTLKFTLEGRARVWQKVSSGNCHILKEALICGPTKTAQSGGAVSLTKLGAVRTEKQLLASQELMASLSLPEPHPCPLAWGFQSYLRLRFKVVPIQHCPSSLILVVWRTLQSSSALRWYFSIISCIWAVLSSCAS